jgi:hypothetical protein
MLPPELKIPKHDVSKHEYHHFSKTTAVQDPYCSQSVGVKSWIDNVNAPVTMMTTVHDLDDTIKKLRRRPGQKSTNTKKSRPAFEGYTKKELPIPTCFADYNHYMGGIDIADRRRSWTGSARFHTCLQQLQFACPGHRGSNTHGST